MFRESAGRKTGLGVTGSLSGWYPGLSRTWAFPEPSGYHNRKDRKGGPLRAQAWAMTRPSCLEFGIQAGKVMMERALCCSGQPGGKQRIDDRGQGKGSGELGGKQRWSDHAPRAGSGCQ